MVYIISAGIVLYNPNIERLKENIISIYPQIKKLYLVDNNSENYDEIKKIIDGYSEIVLIRNNENYGIAKALNQIMEEANLSGYEWNLLLDQDSIVTENYIEMFKEAKDNLNGSKVGILCPVIDDMNSKIKDERKKALYEEIEFCITSGSINNVEVWKKIGGFDESLFIDGVDQDYSIRIIKNNYKIVRLNTISIKHEIGKIKSINFFGINIESFNHSSFRKYYIARNLFYLDTKYKGGIRVSTLFRFIKQILLVVVVEDNKIEKIRSLLLGAFDSRKVNKK